MFIQILSIIVIGGAMGGYASFLSSDVPKDEKHPIARRIFLGIASAAVVPLFLNMISSSIISKDMLIQDLFVLLGFCVIAGFSSKSFLSSVSKQVIEKVNAIDEKQNEMQREIEPIVIKETEPDLADNKDILGLSGELQTLSQTDKYSLKALEALTDGKYSWRSIGGISKATGQKPSDALNTLQLLEHEGLARKGKSSSGSDIWSPTVRGSIIGAFMETS